jgi:hypothetical protein
MARSRNKHSRAALRAKSRRPRKQGSSRWFTITITIIILVGVIGVVLASGVLTRNDSASAAAPQPPSATNPSGDHWHVAFAVNVCGQWLPNLPQFETAADNSTVRVGIHTHGDGFIHVHPFVSSEGGSNATLGKFLGYAGYPMSDSSMKVWTGPSADPTKTEWKNGDKCPNAAGEAGKGKAGRVVWTVNCIAQSGNPSDYRLKDQHVLAVGFLPEGEKLPTPPNAASAPQNDGSPSGAFNQKSCTPTAQNNPGVADTTPTTSAATPTTGR